MNKNYHFFLGDGSWTINLPLYYTLKFYPHWHNSFVSYLQYIFHTILNFFIVFFTMNTKITFCFLCKINYTWELLTNEQLLLVVSSMLLLPMHNKNVASTHLDFHDEWDA